MRSFVITIFALSTLVYTSCTETQYPSGKRYYDAYCGNCHMENGKGLSQLIPSLENSNYLKVNQDVLPCIIRNGILSTVADDSDEVQLSMPAHPELNDIEVLNICNYINNAWGNKMAEINMVNMKTKLQRCEK